MNLFLALGKIYLYLAFTLASCSPHCISIVECPINFLNHSVLSIAAKLAEMLLNSYFFYSH